MQLTHEQQKNLLAKLQQLGQGWAFTCFVCHNPQWNVSDTIFEMREFQQGNLVIGGALFPVIPMTCTKCGYTFFLNALMMGVIDPPQPPASGGQQ